MTSPIDSAEAAMRRELATIPGTPWEVERRPLSYPWLRREVDGEWYHITQCPAPDDGWSATCLIDIDVPEGPWQTMLEAVRAVDEYLAHRDETATLTGNDE